MKDLSTIDDLLFSIRSVEFEKTMDGQVSCCLSDVYFGRGGNAISALKAARENMSKRGSH